MQLDTTSKSLQFALGGVVATNQLLCAATWTDVSGGVNTPGSNSATSNNTTQVTFVAAPASSTVRTINTINIYNDDTAAVTVTISLNVSSTLTTLTTMTIQPGQSMKYTNGIWSVAESSISAQYSSSTSPSGDAGGSLSGTYPNPTVSVLNGGISAPPTAPTTGQVLTATSTSTSGWTTPGSISGVAALSGATFTGAFVPAVVALTDGSSISVNASAGNVFTLTLGGNHTLANPSSPTDGQMIRILVKQDGTGSRTLSYGTAYEFSAGLASPTLSTAANTTDSLTFTYNGSSSKWLLTSFAPAFT